GADLAGGAEDRHLRERGVRVEVDRAAIDVRVSSARHQVRGVGDGRPVQVVNVAVVVERAAVDVAGGSVDRVGRVADPDVVRFHVGLVEPHAAVDVAARATVLSGDVRGGADRGVVPGGVVGPGVADLAVHVAS